ncbi:hypothetical protein C7N43_26940 [Sphingobacteriales bacterium UPWRP_1]|nr:hypothetical protein C7N43_26940 [Sphingobacteriales bacterium UPWRP_1]
MRLLGLDNRVLGMTYSEFGRQIRSNNAFGTDHGTAAPMFVFGAAVKQQVIGNNPFIPDEVDKQEGVAIQYEFADVYASMLRQWLGMSDSKKIPMIFERPVLSLPICSAVFDEQTLPLQTGKTWGKLTVSPQKFTQKIQLTFYCKEVTQVKLVMLNASGGVVQTIAEGRAEAGEHTYTVNTGKFNLGNYYFYLTTVHFTATVQGRKTG